MQRHNWAPDLVGSYCTRCRRKTIDKTESEWCLVFEEELTDIHRTDVASITSAPRLGASDSSAKSQGRAAEAKKSSDNVNRPSHYTSGKVECIDAIEAAVSSMTGVRAFLVGQVIKYVWRFDKKGGVEDLKKAKWYLERLINKESK